MPSRLLRLAECPRPCLLAAVLVALHVTRPAAAQQQDPPPDAAPAKTPAEWVREGNSFFRSGQFDEALKRYEQTRALLPDRAEIAYDRGLARLKLDQLPEAASALNQALLSPDKDIEARAKFLLGNAHHRMALAAQDDPKAAINNLELATQYYADSLALHPGNDDARANIELAQQLIRQLREMQQQQQQQGGDGEKNDKQDDQQEQQKQDQQQDQQQNQEKQDQEPQENDDQQQQQQQSDEESPDREQKQQQQQGDQEQEQQQDDSQQQEQQGDEQQEQKQQSQQQDGQQQDQQEARESEGTPQNEGEAAAQQVSKEQAERLLQKVRDKERQRRLARMKQDIRRAPVKKDW